MIFSYFSTFLCAFVAKVYECTNSVLKKVAAKIKYRRCQSWNHWAHSKKVHPRKLVACIKYEKLYHSFTFSIDNLFVLFDFLKPVKDFRLHSSLLFFSKKVKIVVAYNWITFNKNLHLQGRLKFYFQVGWKGGGRGGGSKRWGWYLYFAIITSTYRSLSSFHEDILDFLRKEKRKQPRHYMNNVQ